MTLRCVGAALLLVLAACCGVGLAASASADASRAATEILASTGVKGGLVVHLGSTDGELTAALHAGPGFLVHGLSADANLVEQARARIRAQGLYGPVSVERYAGGALPYTDNLVNLVVVEDPQLAAMDEIFRVLAPGGIACVYENGQWRKTVKPRPTEIDEWTHALHDASNNAVARDTVVGPPQHVQWVAGPRNARHHEHLSSVSVVLSAGGRLFSVVDEGPIASVLLPAAWTLVARDAFSGVLLWRRPIDDWESHLWAAQSGPAGLARRLVAVDDRVYLAPAGDKPLVAIDAATGQTVKTYDGTRSTEEILCHEGKLFLVVGGAGSKAIVALDARSGRLLWKKAELLPAASSLGVGSGRVCYLDPQGVACLDASDGKELWHAARSVARQRPAWSAPTLVVAGDVVLCADREPAPTSNFDEATGKRVPQWMAEGAAAGQLVAYSAANGEVLWSCRSGEAYHSPADVFVNDGLVWVGQSRARFGPDFTAARDLHTGEIKRRISADKAFETTMPHHRCYRNRATSRYLVTGRTGVEFIDQQTGEAWRQHWVRGACQYGIVPCNGLLYAPPNSCACYIEAKLAGFWALAPEERMKDEGGRMKAEQKPRLEKGPTYNCIHPSSFILHPSDWPTYRHDAARSGSTKTQVPARLATVWQATVGGRLTSPVSARGLTLVAAVDTHTVYALDAQSGRPRWQYTAGGRIDSPPTIAGGLVVFGSADGHVYALAADDGRLAWRFRAAPQDRRIVAFDQVESAWPVHGSVLVEGNVVYCAAGRTSYLDGGIDLFRLDLNSGATLSHERVDSRDPHTGEQPAEPMIFEMPGAFPDVLSCDGRAVYMRRLAFAPGDLRPQKPEAHLYSPSGFLNDDWWHRTYWILGEHFYSGYIGWYFAGREVPAGRLLAIDGPAVYGFSYKPQFYRTTSDHAYQLFGLDRKEQSAPGPADYRRANRDYPAEGQGKFKVRYRWQAEVPLLARAMVLAGDALLLAGPSARAVRSLAAFSGQTGGVLSSVSAKDGTALAQYRLDSLPVFDGLAAAGGRLYVSLQDGRLLCLGDARAPGAKELAIYERSATDAETNNRRP